MEEREKGFARGGGRGVIGIEAVAIRRMKEESHSFDLKRLHGLDDT